MNGRETDKLLAKIAQGDNDAFKSFYLQTRKGVFAFLYSYFKNAPDTEDAMQTVYLKVKMNISSYTVGTNGRAWLFQIAKNHALTLLRDRKPALSIDETPALSYEQAEFSGGGVTECMDRVLSDEEKRIVVLHVLWRYKHREIAKILALPTGTVTSKYKRAIEKLKKALKEEEK